MCCWSACVYIVKEVNVVVVLGILTLRLGLLLSDIESKFFSIVEVKAIVFV